MSRIVLPVRQSAKNLSLELDAERTALLLVDCTSNQQGARREVLRNAIAPVVQAARGAGVRLAYLFESGHGTGGPGDVLREMAGARPGSNDWQQKTPEFDASVAPCLGEPVLGKWHYDGFAEGHIDYYLRSWGIDTVVAVGFRLPCCLYQTCLGARTRNYRVVLLRDCTCPPGTLESDETRDERNPEGGWTRHVFLQWFEFLVGYTATGGEFVDACMNVKNG